MAETFLGDQVQNPEGKILQTSPRRGPPAIDTMRVLFSQKTVGILVFLFDKNLK